MVSTFHQPTGTDNLDAPVKHNRLYNIRRRLTPPQALIISFAALILIGALVLCLPAMTTGSKNIKWLDALFTATSAVCVTGLTVVDTGTAFSPLGQASVLVMIQLGGLGIMTFSIFFLRLVGWGSSLRSELAVRSSLSCAPQLDVPEMVRSVILFTMSVEFIGAVLLFIFFHRDYPTTRALFLAVFHSVSAFCNAGFSLWANSLTAYRSNVGVNLVFVALIVSGGLGFMVAHEVAGYRPKRRRNLSLHSKIVIWTTLALILLGTLVFAVFEWNNVLADAPIHGKIIASLFQSVTTRTAGFNTVNFQHVANTTLLATIFLMFVGGSPGSTAGGIKTVTLAVLVAMAISRYRGFSRVNIFKRSVPEETVARGLAIVLVALTIVGLALTLLLITETGHLDHTQTRDSFLQLLFETVSAFATVGLSMGATPDLTAWGKIIIIITMFLGRVGPLTVALAMMTGSEREKTYNFSTEEIVVG